MIFLRDFWTSKGRQKKMKKRTKKIFKFFIENLQKNHANSWPFFPFFVTLLCQFFFRFIFFDIFGYKKRSGICMIFVDLFFA